MARTIPEQIAQVRVRILEVDPPSDTDFYIIMRQELDRDTGEPKNAGTLQYDAIENWRDFPGFRYENVEDAELKAAQYLRQRHSSGQKFRYFILKPVSIVIPSRTGG